MEAERWRQIEDVFHAALACEPQQRDALLAAVCGADAELRQEVESLLASDADQGFTGAAFQEAAVILEQRSAQALDGKRIGHYRILREIGYGGMGRVYLAARDDQAFQKLVAIKLIRRGLDTDEIVSRFRAERQILATLDHPNITRLLDGGATGDGTPYLVMEYIEGAPIDRFCDEHKLNITDRLKLFQQVCAAVAYAHQNLVIHRDIKPGNVLVTKEGIPRLLDFGVAKFLAPSGSTDVTLTTLRALTPECASPEQIRGAAVTTASDVYSLGVLFYRVLTGVSPYPASASTPAEVEKAVCEHEPGTPSEAAMEFDQATRASLAATREGTPDRLRRRLAGDLDNIALKALRKEPQRRYASADRLSEDIDRHLRNLPVMARPDTAGYRVAKFIRRNLIAVGATALVIISLAAGLGTTLWQAHLARQQRDRARLQQAKAARINAFLQEVVGYSAVSPGSPKRAKGHDATVVDMLDDAARRVETELNDEPEAKADLLSTIGSAYSVNGKYDVSQRYLREAYDLYHLNVGSDSVQMAAVMHHLGVLSYLTGQYTEADAWFRKALAIYHQHANDENFEVQFLPAGLSDEAFVQRALGRGDEAEALWREALACAPRLPAKYAYMGIAPKTYLAQLYVDRGDVPNADAMATQAVQQLRAGSFEFQLPQALIDLGNVRRLERRYPDAESLIQEGTDLFARTQGDDHPNVAFGLAALAMTHYDQGKYDVGEKEARRALAIIEKLPETSHYYAGVITVLGCFLNKTGRLGEAERLLREALALREKTAPRRSNVVAVVQGDLGECLVTQKRHAEAEPLLTESYETLKAIHVPQSPVLREAAQRLATLYQSWGKPLQGAQYVPISQPGK